MMNFFRNGSDAPDAKQILKQLLSVAPQPTAMAPRDCRGIYGLVDHFGELRYIGATTSENETFYKRIHQRHRTGSETASHYFSRMYNTGRMWRERNDAATKADGDIAKKLRNEFVADYCKAVWVPLADALDIPRLEREVIALAPAHAVAWNGRGMDPYDEPESLVDLVIDRLGFGEVEVAALNRQKARFTGVEPITAPISGGRPGQVPPFPVGPFRFVALDVETANHDRGSICQVGVACVGPNNEIETWVTYINPQTTRWVFTNIHGITNSMVAGAPTFEQVLPVLEQALEGLLVYQHSGFDRSAIRAACTNASRSEPNWDWQNSVSVARKAWPELKGNGGHGLASLKTYLGLSFDHHDAGEDARAAAEVVLLAEEACAPRKPSRLEEPFVLIEEFPEIAHVDSVSAQADSAKSGQGQPCEGGRVLGCVTLTQGNINNHHFYLREILHAFPDDCIGGGNSTSAAARTVTVDWGGQSVATTDVDGRKKLFRRRGWVREFFERNSARAGDQVKIEAVNSHAYRVSVVRLKT